MRRFGVGCVLWCASALALASARPHGWTAGTPAAGAERILAPTKPVDVDLPTAVTSRVTRDTLLVYFAPRCPHCQAVAPELNALADRLPGQLDVLGVASGSATAEDVAWFRGAFGLTWPVIHDVDRSIGRAMGARATPAAALLRPDDGAVKLVDLWYPYQPGTDALVEMRLGTHAFSVFEPGEYHGNAVCGVCHTEELASWYISRHGIAWWTLVKASRDDDPACVSCHVTGAGQAGGWTPTAHPELVDVGCEACHSAGGPHDGLRVDATTTCGGCHDEKHSIQFSVERAVPHIDHYAANSLGEDAWAARRSALASGMAPRALTRFAEGEHVGAKACVSCHKKETRRWKLTRHARAMGTLEEAGSEDDAGCVGCHATPATPGLRPTTVDGFLRDEGVGCESCHGPGRAHVDAGGGTTNIERLGDDCPVCVIDALCTSCHDPKHDPDFDLGRDLQRVGHSGLRIH